MSAKSSIEWTDATWNPVTGCDHVSLGCDNCYAERIATRFGRPFIGAVKCHSERLWYPMKWRKPRRVFVNSVSDLFHPDVPDVFIAEAFAVMALSQRHTFQVLTKRPQRMEHLLARMFDEDRGINFRGLVQHAVDVRLAPNRLLERQLEWPLPNVWLGVSVENQRYADVRIPHLLATPAAVRFLSVEPLLGPVALMQPWVDYLRGVACESGHDPECTDKTCGEICPVPVQVQTPPIDWVIVGGESGPGARPIEADWVRTLRDQCVAASVPFFFKQWGGRTPKANGRVLDGRTWDEYPENPPNPKSENATKEPRS